MSKRWYDRMMSTPSGRQHLRDKANSLYQRKKEQRCQEIHAAFKKRFATWSKAKQEAWRKKEKARMHRYYLRVTKPKLRAAK
jgi:hypothetical protein